MSKVTVSVPIVELEKLEQARFELFEFINKYIPGEKQNLILSPLLNITKQMWVVANRRYCNE